MYYNGLGVDEDIQTAYMWFYLSYLTLSESDDDDGAYDAQRRFLEVERYLSPNEIEKAKSDARAMPEKINLFMTMQPMF